MGYILLAGLGAAALLFFQPRWLLDRLTALRPGASFYADNSDAPQSNIPQPQRQIALTLDDGPYPETTDEILTVLAEYDAKATFFVIGDRIGANPDAIARIHQAGHEFGNHLMRDEASAKLTAEQFEADLLATEQILQTVVEKNTSAPIRLQWLRPGMGWYTPEMVAIAQQHQYRIVLGDIFPYDTHLPFVPFAVQQIRWNARPGSIIVLHDGSPGRGQRTAATLRQVLPWLQQRGYAVVTLSQLFADD